MLRKVDDLNEKVKIIIFVNKFYSNYLEIPLGFILMKF